MDTFREGHWVLINLLRDRPHLNGVEVGVLMAQQSYLLLQELPGLNLLYSVDPYRAYEGWNPARRRTPEQFDKLYLDAWLELAKFGNRSSLLRCSSIAAAELFVDGLFDFVYVDDNHERPFVDQSILAWKDKVRPGGLFIGHDWCGRSDWGVKEAACEIFGADQIHKASPRTWYVEVPYAR